MFKVSSRSGYAATALRNGRRIERRSSSRPNEVSAQSVRDQAIRTTTYVESVAVDLAPGVRYRSSMRLLSPEEHIASCDHYLGCRTGKYEWRRIRYSAALAKMQESHLEDSDTIIDVGAGWTEFDVCLRVEGQSHARYFPVDGCLDGTDLEVWEPPRSVEFFVALELLEHLEDPWRLVEAMQDNCSKAIVISTPNPQTTDVLGMDATHRTPIYSEELASHGFDVSTESFYGQPEDSLLGVWTP